MIAVLHLPRGAHGNSLGMFLAAASKRLDSSQFGLRGGARTLQSSRYVGLAGRCGEDHRAAARPKTMTALCNPPLAFGPSQWVRITLVISAMLIALTVGWIWAARPLPEVVLPTSTCDLNQGPCSERLPGGGTLRFEIGPRPIAAAATLSLHLRVSDAGVREPIVDFNGTSMKMVPNRVRLEPTGALVFAGEAALSLCVSGDMTWEARVEFVRDGTRYVRPFIFTSQTPGS